MDNKFYKILFLLLVLSLFSPMWVYCQNFKVAPLIEINGDNYDFDILSSDTGTPNSETYICWVNKLDTTYTVYLKQLSPILGDNIIISSDSKIRSNPLIALNRYAQGIKILWQCKENNAWKVYSKNYLSNLLSDAVLILDSLADDPQISLSTNRIAWVNNGNLFLKEFYPTLSQNILVDSLNCSTPKLIKYDYLQSTQILYVKKLSDSPKINLVTYNHDRTPMFQTKCISNSISSGNPEFGLNWGIAFQTKENNVWKCIYAETSNEDFKTTKNQNCNFNNPVLFTYPIPISSVNIKTPFFLAFDTDSIANNKEVFIKTFYFNLYDSLLNISHCTGDDYKPKVAYLSNADSVFITIIWEHKENNKTDIWFAKDIFSPIISGIKNEYTTSTSFNLIQNYPNPFNPATTIEYTLGKPSNVKIVIYDMLGREIKTLVDEYKNAGIYKEIFNASHLSSGIYFYTLISGNNVLTKSMVLLK